MLHAAKKYFPAEAEFTSPLGGLFLFCTLPQSVDTSALLPVAVDHLVAFIPGEPFFTGEKRVKNTMRLNFSNASLPDIEKGIKLLGGIVTEAVHKSAL